MRTIYKYNLPFQEEQGTLKIPKGYQIIHFGVQSGLPTLWVEVDSDQPSEEVQYAVFGTGWEIPPDWEHVGTWMESIFVWHLYRRN